MKCLAGSVFLALALGYCIPSIASPSTGESIEPPIKLSTTSLSDASRSGPAASTITHSHPQATGENGKKSSSAARAHGERGPVQIVPLVPVGSTAVERYRKIFQEGLSHHVSLNTAIRYARQGSIKEIVLWANHVVQFVFVLNDGRVMSASKTSQRLPLAIIRSGADFVVVPTSPSLWDQYANAQDVMTLATILLVLMLLIQIIYSSRQMTKPQSRRYKGKLTADVTFDDVAGQDEAKKELRDILEYFKSPAKMGPFNVPPPASALLVGPPGNGKTMLAKAFAREAGVPFFFLSGSDFVEMLVGVGARRVRAEFKDGRGEGFKNRLLRRCRDGSVIFIDEIDAVGGARQGTKSGFGGDEERERTLNALLVEMDGVASLKTRSGRPVIVLAATNRSDILDEALLRRFDREITVSHPHSRARTAIVRAQARRVPKGPDVNFEIVGRLTPGFSGAKLAKLVREWSLVCIERNAKSLDMAAFYEARDRVILGPPRKDMPFSDEQRRIIAVHEAGHALVSFVLPDAPSPSRVSIIPHMKVLGHVMTEAVEDEYTVSRKAILDQATVLLAGRAAEEVVFGGEMATSGASQDRRETIKLLTQMVAEYGLSPKAKHVGIVRNGHLMGDPNGLPRVSEYSLAIVDQQVAAEFESVETRASDILSQHKPALLLIARNLLGWLTLEGKDVADIITSTPKDLVFDNPLAEVLDPRCSLRLNSRFAGVVKQAAVETRMAATSAKRMS